MKREIILLLSICVFASCANNKELSTRHDNIKLTISTTKDIVSDTANITIYFENNTDEEIFLLPAIGIIPGVRARSWWTDIFFQDTVQMRYPILVRESPPRKDEYFILKSGEKYIFDFDIDFRKLYRTWPPEEYYGGNTKYGEYSIKIIYRDTFRTHRKAFKGRVESNTIRLQYQKK